jgi:hypothetical protein
MSSFIAVLFKVIPYLWPFIKEMLIGKKTWRQAFRENRGKTIVTVSLAVSLVFNIVLVTKVGHLAVNYLELSRAKEELEKKYKALEKVKTGPPSTPKHPVANSTEVVAQVPRERKPKPTKPVKLNPSVSQQERLDAEVRAEAERIRQREAIE